MGAENFFLFDMGGRTTKGLILPVDVDSPLDGQVPPNDQLKRLVVDEKTLAAEGPEKTLSQFVLLRDAAAEKAGVKTDSIVAAGCCVPTPFDAVDGCIDTGTNLGNDEFTRFPIEASVATALGVKVATAMNDGNAAGSAEHEFGAGKGHARMAAGIWGTGLGGAIVIDGIVIEGVYSAELGHFPAPAFLRAHYHRHCGCGHPDHVEALGCVPALADRAGQRVRDGLCPRLLELGWRDDLPEEDKARLALDCAGEGDAVCLDLVRFCGKCVGAAFACATNVFHPKRFVIGGGIANAPELTKKEFRLGVIRGFRWTTWAGLRDDDEIDDWFVWAERGSMAGMLGMLPKTVQRYKEAA